MFTGKVELITVKVAVTGLNVPGVNAGILTTAFEALMTVKVCSPVPELIESTVIVPFPLVIVKDDSDGSGN